MLSPGRRAEATPLRTSVDLSGPDGPLIRVVGELAYATYAPLRDEVDRVLADAPPTLVLDFGDLHFIDSTGLAVIVHAWREGREVGTTVRLRAVPPFLASILDITGVAGLLNRPTQARAGGQRPAATG
ncbi:STAS domain-containing protein [Micromonospora orduensis]|uniref:STAS domain-containing protein n=1 Tax=Micromonospora orduensis TaxID=1420891 RepID=UPI0036271C2C